jgi:hypothetical protein
MTTELEIYKKLFPPSGDVPASYMTPNKFEKLTQIRDHVSSLAQLLTPHKPMPETVVRFLGSSDESKQLTLQIVALRDNGATWEQVETEIGGVIKRTAIMSRYKDHKKRHGRTPPPPSTPTAPEPPSKNDPTNKVRTLYKKGQTVQQIATDLGVEERDVHMALQTTSSKPPSRAEIDRMIWDFSKEGLTPLSISEFFQSDYGITLSPKQIETRLAAQTPGGK